MISSVAAPNRMALVESQSFTALALAGSDIPNNQLHGWPENLPVGGVSHLPAWLVRGFPS